VLLFNIILFDNSHPSSIIPFFVTLVIAAFMVISIFFSLGSMRYSSRNDININFLVKIFK